MVQFDSARPVESRRRLCVRPWRLWHLGGLLLVATGHAAPTAGNVGTGVTETGTIETIGHQILARERSCVDVIREHAARMTLRDAELNSVIAVNRRATEQARRLDRLPTKRKQALPLLCAPLLVKDNIDVAGMATTAGSVALTGNRASRDAEAVARLRRAGAIVIAKTNMSEFAFNYRGLSSVRGQTRSPFSAHESAGGSSSGNASALAAGFGVIALGTDTSGSVRVPAALTGTIGLRPTHGVLPIQGVMPLSPTQDVIGPMCRAPEDCAAAFEVLAPAELPTTRRAVTLAGLRVGILVDLLQPGDAGQIVRNAVDRLTTAGALVRDLRLEDQEVLVGASAPAGESALFASRSAFDFPDVMDAYLAHRVAVPHSVKALLARLRGLAAEERTDSRVVDDVAKFIANREGAAGDPRHRVNGSFRDAFVRKRIDAAFSCQAGGPCLDMLVYAAARTVSAPVETGPDTGGTHRLAAYSGRPAIAFPIGIVATPAGLRPVAVEIMGRQGSDRELLSIVAAWQATLGAESPSTP